MLRPAQTARARPFLFGQSSCAHFLAKLLDLELCELLAVAGLLNPCTRENASATEPDSAHASLETVNESSHRSISSIAKDGRCRKCWYR